MFISDYYDYSFKLLNFDSFYRGLYYECHVCLVEKHLHVLNIICKF